jgi:hypothetical protein
LENKRIQKIHRRRGRGKTFDDQEEEIDARSN